LIDEQSSGYGYGITADNSFTSLANTKELLKKQKTITGTMKLNQKEVPIQIEK